MEIIDINNTLEYEEFVHSHPKGHFMQSCKWSEVKSAWKWNAVLSRSEDGNIKGSIAVLTRKIPYLPFTIMYSPRGPVCDIHNEKVLNELILGVKKLAKENKAYVFKIDPDIKSSDKVFADYMEGFGFKFKDGKNFEAIQPRYVFRLDIRNKTEEEVLAEFHSKTKYNIKVAIKNGVRVELASKGALSDFHALMLETGVRDGFLIRSKKYFETMLDALGGNARLYVAKHEDKIIAGTLAVLYGDKVWYLYGASGNAYRNVMPNYLLQWEMIKWAIENKCNTYDFRGVSGDVSKDNPLYGLFKFKKGFGGEFTEFIGELDLVFNSFAHFTIEKGQRVFRSLRNKMFLFKNRNKK